MKGFLVLAILFLCVAIGVGGVYAYTALDPPSQRIHLYYHEGYFSLSHIQPQTEEGLSYNELLVFLEVDK
ncbi:unnamed protein product, partial [marine sediment metagenome]